MTMKDYANKGWLIECTDKLAGLTTLSGLADEVSRMEQNRPSWVTDKSVQRLRQSYDCRCHYLSRRLAQGR